MQSARAEEFALSIGRETSGRNDAALALEARTTPVLRLTDRIAVRLAAATELQTSGDLWVGAGAHASAPLSARWRVEISVLPGLYSRGTSGDDLGHTVQFRSRIAISLAFAPRWRIGAAFQHKSNASLGDNNPGAETLLATVSFAP